MAMPLRVLIVEDNPSDAELMLQSLRHAGFDPVGDRVEDEQDFRDHLRMAPEIILADFTLPEFGAVGALQILQDCQLDIPVIIVSGTIGEERAVQVMQQGAADYVMKDRLARLGQAVTRALEKQVLRDEQRRTDELLRQNARWLSLTADVGIALTKGDTLPEMLRRCGESLVRNLDAAMARIWTLNASENELELKASVGLDTHPGKPRADVLVGNHAIGLIAEQRKPYLTNSVVGDARLGDQDWAQREGIASFAGYPLIVEGRLVGVLEIYARQPFPSTILEALTTAADGIALGIERKRAGKSLTDANTGLKEILDAATQVSIIATDPFGLITVFNSGAERMLGYAADEMVGKRTPESIHLEAEVREQVERLTLEFGRPLTGFGALVEQVRRGLNEERQWTYVCKNGDQLTVNLAVTALRDREGKIDGFLGIARDITVQARIEAELREAKEAAEAANRAKSEFLANMSHEIRTPMNGILGLTGLVQATDLSLEQRQYVDGVKLSADTLLKVINDILDFSKGEVGRMELEAIDFDLRETVCDTVKTLALGANEKGLELLCDVRPDVPDALIGDPARLRQIIVNLIGNALKFTPEGEIAVLVEMETSTKEAAWLHFIVSDTGIGIPADKRQAIFEAFTQADGSTTRNYGGTGLGLAISSQLVKLMGGRIWVESEVGHGSKFHFTSRFDLPSTVIPKKTQNLPPELQNLRVLVVDDNATNRRILKDVLTHWRMKPLLVSDGAAALAALQNALDAKEPFDLILLDVAMPGMDGFDVLERLRRQPGTARPTILMLSSRSRRGDIARSRELGAAAYLIKPIKPSELLNAIMTALPHALEGAEPHVPTPLESTVGEEPPLRILVAEDNAINRLVAVRILQKAGHIAEVAANGMEAVDLLARVAFDLILMDVQMPLMDGFEATARIREKEQITGQHMPVVAMTAHAMKGDRERCLDAGMDGYVAKPIQEKVLFAAIAAAVLVGAKSTSEATAKSDAEKVGEVTTALDSQEDEQAFQRELAGMFLEDCSKALTKIREAVARRDGPALKLAAHTLKGSAGVFRDPQAIDAAFQMEMIGRDLDWEHADAADAVLEKEMDRLMAILMELTTGDVSQRPEDFLSKEVSAPIQVETSGLPS
jgi:two-component system, sensor histidine kinase and response regulator